MNLGILGGGQLGRMLALAAYRLGYRVRSYDPLGDACAGQVSELVVGSYEDIESLEVFARGLDVVTFEFENVPVEAAQCVAEIVPVFPIPASLDITQDRLSEKTLFGSIGMPVARFAAVDSRESLGRATGDLGLPAILKTRRQGYDGKGQWVIDDVSDLDDVWMSTAGSPCILEQFVEFQREVSLIVARSADGAIVMYPWVENEHREGILRLSRAPARFEAIDQRMQAESFVRALVEDLNYIGVLAVEFFEVDGSLLANEIAPRVHNSGHWTIEGAVTSQFENHVRAVSGQPLGDASPVGYSCMINLIGHLPRIDDLLRIPTTHVHAYGKQPRPGRKLGHVTVTGSTEDDCNCATREVLEVVGRERAATLPEPPGRWIKAP